MATKSSFYLELRQFSAQESLVTIRQVALKTATDTSPHKESKKPSLN